MHHTAVVVVALSHDQFFFLQPVDNAGQIANGDHHLLADFTERKPPGIANRRENVKLRRREAGFVQIAFKLFVRLQTETKKADPKTGGV